MSYDDRREIFERLEALERMLRSGREERGGRHDHRHGGHDRDHRGRGGHDRDRGHDHHRGRGGDDFEEKRIIDTVVRLVCEQMGRMLDDRQASAPRPDAGDEKRIINLIVGLVSEHVQEIVSTELDRRLGRADAPRDGGGRPAHGDDGEPEQR